MICVLDACALIAHIKEEPGADVVQNLIDEATDRKITLHMSIVNLIEVHYGFYNDLGKEASHAILEHILKMPIQFHQTIDVKSGTFNMAGGFITGNTASGNGTGMGTWGGGGGVYINGTFNMTGGTISGNTSRGQGGGVQSNKFTMSGGTISGNTASGEGGGGVYVYRGTFTMSGGTISGNIASRDGGGVNVYSSTFIKSGTGNAVIYGSNAEYEQANRARDDGNGHAVYFGNGKKRNTTARAATAMDSTKDGPAGGWE